DPRRDQVVNQLAQGLLGLRGGTQRTLILLACLATTWTLIRQRAVATVADRFRRPPLTLQRLPSAEVAQAIVERHLAARYRQLGFIPRSPSGPVRPSAFGTAQLLTPRDLLERIAVHVSACVDAGAVTELVRLDEPVGVVAEHGRGDDESPEFAV